MKIQIHRQYEIDRCVSTDTLRGALQCVHVFDACAIASDGKMAVRVPCAIEQDDSPMALPVLLPKESFKQARKTQKCDTLTFVVGADGIIVPSLGKFGQPIGGEMRFTLQDFQARTLALFDQVMNPSIERVQTFQIRLDADLLRLLAAGLDSSDTIVTLGFAHDHAPVKVTAGKTPSCAVGVLMPCRMS